MSMEDRLPQSPYDSEQSLFNARAPKTAFRPQSSSMYLLSSLFRAEYMAEAEFMQAMPIATLHGKKQLLFTGERFDQWDLDVLLYCALHTPLRSGRPEPFQFTPGELLHDFGMRNTVLNRQRVGDSLRRLHNGVVEIKGDGYRYMTRFMDRVLVDSRTERYIAETNGDVATAFRADSTACAARVRKHLRNDGLAKWLHGAISIHKGGITADYASLHALSAPKVRTMRLFSNRLDKALALLRKHDLVETSNDTAGKIQIISRVIRTDEGSCGIIRL